MATIDPVLKKYQQALQNGGYNVAADGVYGPQTKAALSQFQMDAALPVTGLLDSATKAAIDGATAPSGPASTLSSTQAQAQADSTGGTVLDSSGTYHHPSNQSQAPSPAQAQALADATQLPVFANDGTYYAPTQVIVADPNGLPNLPPAQTSGGGGGALTPTSGGGGIQVSTNAPAASSSNAWLIGAAAIAAGAGLVWYMQKKKSG